MKNKTLYMTEVNYSGYGATQRFFTSKEKALAHIAKYGNGELTRCKSKVENDYEEATADEVINHETHWSDPSGDSKNFKFKIYKIKI